MTLAQAPGSARPALIGASIVLVLNVLFRYFLDGKTGINYEVLAFQLTMPGIDEEFAFRGVMLGILCTALSEDIRIGKLSLGSPAIYITAILFGFIHAFQMEKNATLHFDWFYFVYTYILGHTYGWIALRTRSILIPVIAHNLCNFTGNLAIMLK